MQIHMKSAAEEAQAQFAAARARWGELCLKIDLSPSERREAGELARDLYTLACQVGAFSKPLRG